MTVTSPGPQIAGHVSSSGPQQVITISSEEMVPFEHQMSVAQTTATFSHPLGRNPVAVQVFDEDGVICSEYGVVFTMDAQEIRVSFDVSVQALIRIF